MSATLVSNLGWFPASWRRFPASQMPSYPDPSQLNSIEARLHLASPVIAIDDAHLLRQAMAGLAEGQGFLLQGGDCAESFDDPVAEQVAGIVGLFDDMAEKIQATVSGPLIEVAQNCRPVRQTTKRPNRNA